MVPYMYSEMQNKLSKIRESPLESMGQILSSRCPFGAKTTHFDVIVIKKMIFQALTKNF